LRFLLMYRNEAFHFFLDIKPGYVFLKLSILDIGIIKHILNHIFHQLTCILLIDIILFQLFDVLTNNFLQAIWILLDFI
jgi:hypothetical protein